MTINGAIMQLTELWNHPMMPVQFKPAIEKVIETVSELEEHTPERTETHACDYGKKETHGDVIYRQDAIDVLHKKRIETMEKGQDVNLIWECLDVVAQVPSAHQWIPVTERLPEKDSEDVLAYDGLDMFVAWVHNGYWYSSDSNFDIYTSILAWMPLPEPPFWAERSGEE